MFLNLSKAQSNVLFVVSIEGKRNEGRNTDTGGIGSLMAEMMWWYSYGYAAVFVVLVT